MYNNIVKENRKEDLDILRVIAIIFVLSVHGLSYIGFYEHRFSGGVMFILSVVRTLDGTDKQCNRNKLYR